MWTFLNGIQGVRSSNLRVPTIEADQRADRQLADLLFFGFESGTGDVYDFIRHYPF